MSLTFSLSRLCSSRYCSPSIRNVHTNWTKTSSYGYTQGNWTIMSKTLDLDASPWDERFLRISA